MAVDVAGPRGLSAGRREWACLPGPRVSPASVSRLWSRTKTSESEPRRIAVLNGAPDCPVEGGDLEDSETQLLFPSRCKGHRAHGCSSNAGVMFGGSCLWTTVFSQCQSAVTAKVRCFCVTSFVENA
uniref:Uncharacterized protein n=1 Tax=Mus spicilegus TaxID=10103 RepID=A0A8C6HS41_MUSSI